MERSRLSLRRLDVSPTAEPFESPFTGRSLLAGVVGYSSEELQEVIFLKGSRDWYEWRLKKKRNLGATRYRHLLVPHPTLRRFQNRFLRYFLYRMLNRGFVDVRIRGFIPRSSHVRNARFHARPETEFTVRLDLQDAFPSVRIEQVRRVLWNAIEKEIALYEEIEASRRPGSVGTRRKCYPNPPFFPWRKVKWFRRIFKGWIPWSRLDPREIGADLVRNILPLVTFREQLPQGAPTSPFLLNLVLSQEGIPEKMYHWFRERGTNVRFSVYADDFTISSATPISREAVEGCIEMVERESGFRFNREKICYFDRRQGAPLVTGLRLVRIPAGSGSRRSTGDTVSVPKRKIRKIRGIVHRAIYDPELRVKAKGYVDYLHGVYGSTLPPQVAAPWERLRMAMGAA